MDDVDASALADGKVTRYDVASAKHKYVSPGSRAAGATIVGIGDSIMQAGFSTTPNIAAGILGRENTAQNFLLLASMISQAKLQFGGVSATTGFTAAQVLATHVPIVTALSPKPAMCLVLAGTNDFGVTNFATWQSTMTSIYQALLDAGILPIAATCPPSNALTAGNETAISAYNVWIARTAARMGIPCVDFYGALVADNSNFAAGLNSDNIHQSAAGAKVMGQALWTLLQNLVPQAPPWLSQDQPTTDTTRLLANALFLTDSNADGIPDLWAVSGSPTVSLGVDTANFGARSGKVWTITRAAATATVSTGNITVTPGHRLWWAVKFSTSGVEAAGGSIDLKLAATDLSTYLLGLNAYPIKDAAGSATYVLAGEVVMPAGLPSNQLTFNAMVRVGGTIKLAQPTLVDLTAAGIA